MDPLINKPRGGGDTRSPQAISAAAQREEQVVALRLRGIKYAPIARQVGISKQAAQKIFERALRSNVSEDLETFHRTQLAELESERKQFSWEYPAEHTATPGTKQVRRKKFWTVSSSGATEAS